MRLSCLLHMNVKTRSWSLSKTDQASSLSYGCEFLIENSVISLIVVFSVWAVPCPFFSERFVIAKGVCHY